MTSLKINFIESLDYSAKYLSLRHLKKIFWYNFIFCLIIGIINQNIILNLLLLLGNLAIFLNQIFKIFLTFNNVKELNTEDTPSNSIKTEELPLYTILVPLYKEAAVVKQLVANLSSLNYPTEKLQVLLLCEEDDHITLKAFNKIQMPAYFEIITIPASFPRTKPKACNYGLALAKGEYITIYDADDKPDVNQLMDVVKKFKTLAPEFICIQAKLNYYNRTENILTKLFAIEYFHWFEVMLPSLYKYKMIIPLGGTSNHFITKKLCEIGGWDSYNVTEDAELGLRIIFKKYKTYLLNSITLEEAPLTLKAWSIQRSRWIKGYIQTYLVYLGMNRKLGFTLKENIGFHLFIGLPMLSYILVPFIALIVTCDLGFGNTLFINLKIHYLCKLLWELNLVLMIFLPIIIAIYILRMSKWSIEILTVINYPFYWFLHTISSYRAIYQLFKKTFYWDKTEHGLTQIKPNSYKEK
jgi:cellulose synthase/poly-beta-1,6-N-acetylglucosamine synthase-like glycosyltransferase